MAKYNPQIIQKQSRKFEYEKGDIKFAVTLRTDIKTEMKDYLAILELSKTQVEEQLALLG